MVRVTRFPIIGASALSMLLLQSGCDKSPNKSLTADVGAPPMAAAPAKVMQASLMNQASAVPNSFDEVAAQLDRGGSLYFYLSTEQWLAGLSQQMAGYRDLLLSANPTQDPNEKEQISRVFDILTDLLKNGGIEQLSGVGASSLTLEPGVSRNKFFLHHGKGQGSGFLWTLLGKAPHPLDGLDLLPEKTAFATSMDLDLPQLLGIIRQEIDRSGVPEAKLAFEQGLANLSITVGAPIEDLLKSLGGSVGLIVTLDPAKAVALPDKEIQANMPAPQVALFLPVKDDRIFQQIDKVLGQNPEVARVEEPDLHMRSMPATPALPGLVLRPSVALSNGMLIIGSDDQVIRDMLAARAGKAGFKSSPEFAKLSADMPKAGNGFQLTTKLFTQTFLNIQSEMMKHSPGVNPDEMALFQKLFGNAVAANAYGVSSHLENGWLNVSKTQKSAAEMAGTGSGISAPGAMVAAALGLPVIQKAEEHARAAKAANQER